MMIRIVYKEHKKILPDLDKDILKAMKAIGLQWTGQGYNPITGERDICFFKETEGI